MNRPWKCSKCRTAVFIPAGRSDITGGVCTQQRQGCPGEISEMTEEEAIAVRALMVERGISEQAWLTLVFTREAP